MNKKFLLSVIGVIIVILLGIGVGYLGYKLSEKKEELPKMSVNDVYNKYKGLGYDDMDFPEKLSTLYWDVTDELEENELDIMAIYNNEEVTYIMKTDESNKLYYELFHGENAPQKINTEITNVKQVFYQVVGTAVGSEQVIILTESGDIYYKYHWLFSDIEEIPTKLEQFQKLNHKYQYDEIKMYNYNLGNPAGPTYELIGITNNQYKTIIYSDTSYESNKKVYETDYTNSNFENVYESEPNITIYTIQKDGKFCNYDYVEEKCLYNITDVMVKKIIYSYYDILFIDTLGYLYTFDDKIVQKVNDMKVQYTLRKNIDSENVSIIIIYEDGNTKEYRIPEWNIANY